MLSSSDIVRLVANKLKNRYGGPLVVDPVMVAKGGNPLLKDEAVQTVKDYLIPQATVITPNIPEAEVLTGMKATDANLQDMCKKLFELGCGAVVLKGGHSGGAKSVDILYDGDKFMKFEAERFNTKNTHGTGCTFASAIAANLAGGFDLYDSVKNAKDYITGAIKYSDRLQVGLGHGPVDHFFML